MKNTVFNVPDNFFEEGRMETMAACRKIRARRRVVAGTLCGLAIVIGCAWGISHSEKKSELLAAETESQEILDTYYNDIFLMNLTY